MIRDALEPFAPGQIGRYDDEFEVRAFGDNITLWGTPVVLIETGPWPASGTGRAARPPQLRRHRVGARRARDRQRRASRSAALRVAADERVEAVLVLVRNATVINGTGVPPFTADIGLVASRRVQIADGRRELQTS